jgi:P27 family predicted phage terminase small subunit
MRGRIPVPPAIKALQGKPVTAGPGPQFDRGAEPPDWLDAHARSVWDRCAQQLDALGMLTRVDAEALANYCDACSTVKGLSDLQQNPATEAKDKIKLTRLKLAAMALQSALGQQFGFTPASRTKIHVPVAPVDELEDWQNSNSSEGSQ